MKPTHVIKTLDGGRYLMDLSNGDDDEVIIQILQMDGGITRITYMVEDKSVYDKVTYVEKTAILACRAIVAVEEL